MQRFYFDGGARPNPGEMEAAVVVDGGEKHRKALGHGTNNKAEWTALIWAAEIALAAGLTEVEFAGDSQLVVNQSQGLWKIKESSLLPYKTRFSELAVQFEAWKIIWVRRDKNPAGWLLET